ncbi:MAG: Fur family transcriptional regulator [Flavobacteriales bacterium]|nr:Fur family transcriptional regulator [Flavobacteriales bacterium]
MNTSKTPRNTIARTEILKLVNDSVSALSHADVQVAINGLCDRVTIYRVLDRLVEDGSIHRIVNVDGIVRYASCHTCEEGHHHYHDHVHFSCDKCKSVTCLEEVVPSFKLPRKYQVKEVNFTVRGLCPSCR